MALSREKLAKLPREPGVYLFSDAAGALLYIGKAKDLRRRVSSYFAPGARLVRRIARMARRVTEVQVITTLSEEEALAHEASLIRERQPEYNIALKFARPSGYLRLGVGEAFPRLEAVAEVLEDGAAYFGPYASPSAMLMLKDTVDRHFQLRKQPVAIGEKPRKPCWNYQLRRCHAPCAHRIDEAEYRTIVEEVSQFLRGEREPLLEKLNSKMLHASSRHEYEWAAQYRDQIQALVRLFSRQEAVTPEPLDRDVIAARAENGLGMLCLLVFRRSRLMGMHGFPLEELEAEELDEAMECLLKQHYAAGAEIPPEILMDRRLPDSRALKRWLSGLAGRPVRLRQPGTKQDQKLVEMAAKNVELSLKARLAELGPIRVLERLRDALGLQNLPRRIECIDASHFQGQDIVASLVVCVQGKMERSQYRRYRIEGLEHSDDFASVAQVVARRLDRQMAEDGELPDCLLIDGGAGQLSAAWAKVRQRGLETRVDTLAIAKARPRAEEPAQRRDRIFRPGNEQPAFLDEAPEAMRLLQGIRDEAHRFALDYQRSLRGKRLVASELDQIPGVGPIRKRELLRALGSVARIASASFEQLAEVSGMDVRTAQRIHAYFQQKRFL